jgi:hypothetical protein
MALEMVLLDSAHDVAAIVWSSFSFVIFLAFFFAALASHQQSDNRSINLLDQIWAHLDVRSVIIS